MITTARIATRLACAAWTLALLIAASEIAPWSRSLAGRHTLLVVGILLACASCLTIIAVLGRQIAPVQQSFDLGYDAGIRDGLSRTSLNVVRLHTQEHCDKQRATASTQGDSA